MNEDKLLRLLEEYRAGQIETDQMLDQLKTMPYEKVEGFAHVDHHRALRCGFPEVIFGEGKTGHQIVAISERLLKNADQVLITRLKPEIFEQIQDQLPDGKYNAQAKVFHYANQQTEEKKPGVVVISAGTTDIPVAEEAAITAEAMGSQVERIFDVGVAGLHRLLGYTDALNKANVIVVAAGMEGALPSVVGGLVQVPVIALPTSVGYGASFHGLSALLGMLNSCANGISVVNIDNGFGAGYLAGMINRQSGPVS
ncbi:MAG: nickel pincer cofactor biosynthesis protein LarB [Anaerolineaceae bacterium]|nr:nickel pincer cofactor biosynthesis protein LarB [Anaerolineaceae bacterium]